MILLIPAVYDSSLESIFQTTTVEEATAVGAEARDGEATGEAGATVGKGVTTPTTGEPKGRETSKVNPYYFHSK